jgi:E3 ubiquitin-protein ligase BRE1
MHSTQKLITSFMQLSAQKQSTVLHNETHRQCQKAQNEVTLPSAYCFHRLTVASQCIALKSEISLMRKKLHDTESQSKRYHADLVAAETRADRLRSSTVLAMQARASEGKKESKAEDVEEPKPEAPPSPPVSGPVNW